MPEELIDRMGGAEAVREIVSTMYDRVVEDPDLAHFFSGVDLERLKRMQYEFIAAALGGPVRYSGAELQAVHQNRGITPTHFAKFVGHLADVMELRGVAKADVDAMLGQIAMYRDKIVGASNVDG